MGKHILNKSHVHLLLILLLSILAYSNTFQVPFHFDDITVIATNPITQNLSLFAEPSRAKKVHFYSEYKGFRQRYFGFLTFALNYKLHGPDVTGYHIVNIAIHVINGMLVYWLVFLLLRSPYFSAGTSADTADSGSRERVIAFTASLLFVLHPIQTQAVTYISQRFTSLAGMFYLLALVLYIKSRSPERGSEKGRAVPGFHFTATSVLYYISSILSVILAMVTKEIAFTLPFIIALFEFLFLKGTRRLRVLFLIPIFITLLIIPFNVIGFDKPLGEAFSNAEDIMSDHMSISGREYLITQLRVLVTYLRLIFLPINLNLDYDYPLYQSFFNTGVFLSFLLLLTLFGAGILLLYRSRHTVTYMRIVSFGIFWFFITLSVESSVIPLNDVINEHRLYLPSIGVFLAVIFTLLMLIERLNEKWSNIHKPVFVIIFITALVMTGATYARNTVWKDGETLWRDVVHKSPKKARGYNNLGLALYEKNKLDDALAMYEKSIAIEPDADVYNNIGLIYYKKRRYRKAVAFYRSAIRMNPRHAKAHTNLGLAFGNLGLRDLAYEEMRKGMELGSK